MLQIGQRIGSREFALGLSVLPDDGFALRDLVDEPGSRGDEAKAGDFFAADDAFEEERMIMPAEKFKGADRRQSVGEQLPIDGDDLGAWARASSLGGEA